MPLSFNQLIEADFSTLSEAVDKWRNLPEQFDTIASSFDRTVTQGLRESEWKGEAAHAALERFPVVDKEMKAASDEAKDVYDLLNSALETFRNAQKDLKLVKDYVHDDENLHINSEGTVYCDPPNSKGSTAIQKAYIETVRSCTDRIEAALTTAEAADEALHWALTWDANGRQRGFNTETASSIKEAKRERKRAEHEAKEMVELARLGDGMKTSQIERMNKVLSKYEGDPFFNERFTTGLGAKGALRFWAEMADPHKGGNTRVPYEHSAARLDQLESLQDNLSRTFASATHSDSGSMQKWEKQIIDLGGRKVETDHAGGPFGFQVMSNLMREGSYDTDFLQKYGNALKEDDKRFNEGPYSPSDHWTRNSTADLNFGAKDDRGQDPMTGFMEALGHNPEASTKFLSVDDNFDYLATGRDWPSDGTGDSDTGGSAGYRSLSHAFESATTGHSYDAGPSANTPAHTKEQAEIMTKIVKGIGDPDSDFKLHEGMERSFGQAAAEYMPDIHRALSGGNGGGDTLEDLYPLSGAQANFSEQDITRFMYDLGQTPDGYKAINIGETLYSSNLINYHFAHPDAYGLSLSDTLEEISSRTSEVQGTVGLGRADSEIQKSAEGDAKFNAEKDSWKTWTKSFASVGIGVGVGAATTPVGGALAAVALNDISGQMIDKLFGDPRDSSETALYQSGANWENHKESTLRATQDAAEIASEANQSDLNTSERQRAVREGHSDGNGFAHDVLDEYRRKQGKTG
ncbi:MULTISPECIES: DUF6571 family protein [unclassified Streptomyces]|uniref:DUF6571 family protein n=1 Tax=unclassified Streptomyces TaxID=2593676 RepID=UPI0033E3F434